MEMRKVFADEMDNIMQKNSNVVLINADLAKPNGVNNLEKKYNGRAFNVGIAEQNMACIAAGMSSYGFIPFIVTFTPFATRRICDQISVSIAYAKQNVKIVGTDPGISAEFNGGTHMSVEDIGVLRSIPGLVIFEPVDCVQLKSALPKIVEYDGAVYIRMFRKELPKVFDESYDFNLFKADIIKEGNDVTILCSGLMVQEVIEANKQLLKMDIDAEIINVHTIKPLDEQTILKSVKKTGKVVVAENHNIIGGLRSAVCEFLSENYPIQVIPIGINDCFGQVGKIPFLKEEYNMNSNSIIKAVCRYRRKYRKAYKERRGRRDLKIQT